MGKVCIQTRFQLSHQALDDFLKEFRKLQLQNVANRLFHLTVHRQSASREYLLQRREYLELAGYRPGRTLITGVPLSACAVPWSWW